MKTVLVMIPSYEGKLPLELVDILMSLQRPEGWSVHFGYAMRTMIDIVRNQALRAALENEADYVLFVDDDTLPPRDILIQYLEVIKETGADVVGCPVPNRVGEDKMAVFDFDYSHIQKINGTQEVGAVGMSSTLISAAVIKKLSELSESPFEFKKISHNGVMTTFSEDVLFCKKAREVGFKVFATDKVRPIHLGFPQRFQYNVDNK